MWDLVYWRVRRVRRVWELPAPTFGELLRVGVFHPGQGAWTLCRHRLRGDERLWSLGWPAVWTPSEEAVEVALFGL